MAVKREYQFHQIRANSPVEIGKCADITLIDEDGSWQRVSTSKVENYWVNNLDNSIRISTANSHYCGEFANPEIMRQAERTVSLAEALQNLQRDTAAMGLGQ